MEIATPASLSTPVKSKLVSWLPWVRAAARANGAPRSLLKIAGVPEFVAPHTAHPAFNKAAHYLGIKVVRVPEGPDFRADVPAMADAITDNTIGMIGSAPQFWHGVIDPISALGELTEARNLWLHVDGCMGGFLNPFVRKAGNPIPDFDFAVPGVKSISADLHKYGYTLKGASVMLLSDAENRKYQVFDWQDQYERYVTPTFSGTRSGAAQAAAWAVLQFLGESGFVKMADSVMRSQRKLVDCVKANDDLALWGEPESSIVSFGSPTLDVFAISKGLERVRHRQNQKGDSQGSQKVIQAMSWVKGGQPWMTRPYSEDLRERVVRVVESGISRNAAAKQFDVSISFVVKLMQRWKQRGTIKADKYGGWKKSKLAPHGDRIRALVMENCDITIDELCVLLAAEGIEAKRSTLGDFLLAQGLSRKKRQPTPPSRSALTSRRREPLGATSNLG